MAELSSGELRPPLLPEIPASTQILAVAWLRWRIFINSTFRRRPKTKGQVIGLVLAILLRMIVWPFMAFMLIGPVVGCGLWAWQSMSSHHPERLQALFATITVGWQFVAVNGLSVAAAISTFDPASLIRYPLRFGRYFILRTLIGFMTPSTVVGFLCLLAVVVGVGIAQPSLILPAFVVLAVYALMNMFLTRMIGAWMERWFANRYFREIFGVLMGLFAIGIQLLNIQRYPSAYHHGMPHSWVYSFLQNTGSTMHWLPPGLASNAILGLSHPFSAFISFAGLTGTTILFAGVFAIRLHKQFLGEYLSDGTSRRGRAKTASRAKVLAQPATPVSSQPQPDRPGFPPAIAACLRKEWFIFRGNSAQMFGMLTPLLFIVLLNRGQFATHPTLFLPAAVAYALLGTLASLYNVFGGDGLGVQMYFLAPVRMRDVIVAKNIASLALIVTEAILAWTLVLWLKRTTVPLPTQVSTALWMVFVIALNVVLGTLRSIQAPRRFVPGQVRGRRGVPANRTSGLIVLFVLFGSMLVLLPVVWLSNHLNLPWLATWIFGPLAVGAVAGYAVLLQNADRLMLAHRDELAGELCKA